MEEYSPLRYSHQRYVYFFSLEIIFSWKVITGYEAFKSISRILGPRAKNPTLGSQHAVEAGYSKCMCLFVLAFYSLSLF